jgi:DNA adenine methylase
MSSHAEYHYVEPYFGAGSVLFSFGAETSTKAIKWHGGKHYLAPWITSHFPEDFAKARRSEVVNDINGPLTNFWRVLAHDGAFEEFKRIVEATPVSKPRWEEAAAAIASRRSDNGPAWKKINVEAAVDFFVFCRQSRQALMKDFATLSKNRTRRGMNETAASWWGAVEGLGEVRDRLRGVVIYNEKAVDVILREDGPNTIQYLDPPYLHSERSATEAYEHEMDEDDHEELLQACSRLKGRFLLSGYRSDLYDRYARRYGWCRDEIEIDNKSSSASAKEIKTECLWMNFDPGEGKRVEVYQPTAEEGDADSAIAALSLFASKP